MKRKLGEILIGAGVVSAQDVEVALSGQALGDRARLGEILVSQRRISTQQLARALSVQHSVPYVELPPVPASVLQLVPMDFQRIHRVAPFRVEDGRVSVAVAEPGNVESLEALKGLLAPRLEPLIFVAPGDAIDALHDAPGTASFKTPPPAVSASTISGFYETTTQPAAALRRQLESPSARAPAGNVVLDTHLTQGPPQQYDDSNPIADATLAQRPFDMTGPQEGSWSPLPSQSPVPSRESAITHPDWSKALETIAPSRLIVAVTKALLRRGLLQERDIIDSLSKKD